MKMTGPGLPYKMFAEPLLKLFAAFYLMGVALNPSQSVWVCVGQGDMGIGFLCLNILLLLSSLMFCTHTDVCYVVLPVGCLVK
jgi:hypothetical protein